MRKKIFKALPERDTVTIFFNIVFLVPSITQILTYIWRNSFFPFFFSTMQYKAISNAVNCFCSQIKHYLNFLSWATLFFFFFADWRGGGGGGLWNSLKTHPIHFTRSEEGKPFFFMKFLSPRGFH